MRHNDRNPWQGLTSAQCDEIDRAYLQPHRVGMEGPQRWRDVQREYADRCAVLLFGNDLRGAMAAAEVAAAAHHMANGAAEGLERARDRLAHIDAMAVEDPRGTLTYVPGKKRRVRVKPADALASSH